MELWHENDPGTEAEAMQDQAYMDDDMLDFSGYWDDEDAVREHKEEKIKERLNEKINLLKSRYQKARSAKIGKIIECPVCRKKFVKEIYNKIFCSNQRNHKGSSSCKDIYWNTIDERKRQFVRNQI